MHPFGALSLLPALAAIVLAFWSRNVVLSLTLATWIAATMVMGWDPFAGAMHLVDPLILDAVADRDHMKVTLFSLFVGATVGIMSKGKGTQALVEQVIRVANTRRSGMVASWLAGLVVFFDDYANCLIVGSSMQPLADRLRISREKLAYIVDSTAAPIASLALVSTWVGYEVGLVGDGLAAAGQDIDAYAFFVEGISYRFYSLFTIVFVGLIAFTGRDFGPMVQAEQAAAAAEPDPELIGQKAQPVHRMWLGILPIAALIAVAAWDLWTQGTAASEPGAAIFEIIGNADGYDAMLKASVASTCLALVLAMGMRALNPKESFDAAVDGMSTLFDALIVLFLAWSLGAAMGELDAAGYLVSVLEGTLSASLLPTLVFVVAAVTAFATGTSFGTMGILMPMVVPLTFAIAPDSMPIAFASVGAVLSGACWGDHCSPISDTTVLSSLGTGCDHVSHVRTQLPYAMATGVISVVAGTLPIGFGAPVWVCLVIGAVVCFACIRILGKDPLAA
jgi:Na+/H+ antiporter NhaC